MSATLAEVAAALAKHGGLGCHLVVEQADDGGVTVTIDVPPDVELSSAGFTVTREATTLSLRDELQYVADIGSMRALCARYDIDTSWLTKWLSRKE